MQGSRVLITNNTTGNHDPERWAMITAQMIADVSELQGERLIAAQMLQTQIAEILAVQHDAVQQSERDALRRKPQHVLTDVRGALNGAVNFASVLAAIVQIASTTPWAEHFKDETVQNEITALLKDHFYSSMHVERLAHADSKPDCPHAQQYKSTQGAV